VCVSGVDDSIYVDLYDGTVNIMAKMVEAGFAVRSTPLSEVVWPQETGLADDELQDPEYVFITIVVVDLYCAYIQTRSGA